MTRDDLIDACVYGCVNANPTISIAGIHHTFRGFTFDEVVLSTARLERMDMLASERVGGDGQLVWSVVVPA